MNLYELVKNNGVQILDVLGLSTKWYSYIYGGHGDVDPGSKLENKMHDTENEEGYDKDHSRVSAVSCFNGNINSRFSRSIKSNLDQFDDKAIPNSIGGVANPEEPGFLWIDAPRQATITELANKDSKVTKIGDKYWVYDGADEAYPLMDQKIHDAEDQAEKDAEEYLEKGDNKVCSITIKVSALSYIDIGLGTLDFTKVLIPPGKEQFNGYENTYNFDRRKWRKKRFNQSK